MSVEVGTVFGAAEREQRVTEAPSSVTIVTAEDIRTFGWRTLAEALSSVRGFYVTNDRNYTYVGRARLRPAERLQQPRAGAGQRPPLQRQRLRPGARRPRVPDRPGARRSHRGDPRTGLGALRHQRVLRGDQRRAAAGRGGRRQRIERRSRAASTPIACARAMAAAANPASTRCFSVSHLSSDGQSLLYFPEYDEPDVQLRRQPRRRSANRRRACSGRSAAAGCRVQGAYVSRRKVRADRFLRDHAGRQQLHRRLTAAGSTRWSPARSRARR